MTRRAERRSRVTALTVLPLLLLLPWAMAACGSSVSPGTPPPSSDTGTAAASSSPGPARSSGIDGVVVVDRGCPTVPVGATCPVTPSAGTTVSVRDASGTLVGSPVTSAGDGTFHLALEPGRYQLTVRGGMGMPAPAVAVVVERGRYSQVRLRADSGVR